MASDLLDRLLTALTVRLHAFSVCEIQRGARLSFPMFEAVTIHFVLHGSGHVLVGSGPWLAFGRHSVIIVPPRQKHLVGEPEASALLVQAEDHCATLGDGLVVFTAGDGTRDILLLCGTIPAGPGSPFGLLDLLRQPMVQDFATSGILSHVFEHMLAEVAHPGLGTQAMTEMLMKQCLITLLRQHLLQGEVGSPLLTALHHPRLARAVVAVIENPSDAHSVESLASLAGMSRASFADHFARAFQQGPIDFVQKVRLRLAARLLTTTDLPLKVIARSVGYAGATAFSRAFRSVYGADPAGYRVAGGDDGLPRRHNALAALGIDAPP